MSNLDKLINVCENNEVELSIVNNNQIAVKFHGVKSVGVQIKRLLKALNKTELEELIKILGI